jgi:hypothetical protein
VNRRYGSNELLVADERLNSERLFGGFEMTPLLLVCVAVAAPLVGFGLWHMQARLEQWDYERHADD